MSENNINEYEALNNENTQQPQEVVGGVDEQPNVYYRSEPQQVHCTPDPQAGYNSWQNQPYDTSPDVKKTKKVKKAKDDKPKKPRSGHAGLIAGVVAAALVVGLGSGFVGSMLANGIGTGQFSLPSGLTSSAAPTETSENAVTNSVPHIEDSPATAAPLNESKINDDTNSELLTTEELYAKVKDSVVVLYNYQQPQGYNEPVKVGVASGVIFTADGYIITNAHVVDGAVKMTALVNDPDEPDKTHEYEAEILGSDSASDLAVVKITRDEPFTYAKLGNSDTVRVGQDVCALGNPNSLTSSLTKGIVSGLGRAAYSGSNYGCSSIQIDAAVNVGNSGGGLFDMYGNVIGIIDYKLMYTSSGTALENIGFAITINEAKPIIEDLMSIGYVTNRPGLGINGEMLGDYAAYMYGYPSTGLRVTYIDEEMPVAKSGLRVGDVIIEINGIEVTSMTDVQNEISNHNIGDTVELVVLRASEVGNIKEVNITAELAEIKLA